MATEAELSKMLDAAKMEVFRSKNAAFLGSIMCSLDFYWKDDSVPYYVATDGNSVFWRISDFLRCDPYERKCTIIHEVWHPARLHTVRGIGKDQEKWNEACDLRINNDMILDGYKLPDNGFWIFDPSIDSNGILSEEQIYELLMSHRLILPPKKRGSDMLPLPMSGGNYQMAVQKQIQAVMTAKHVMKSMSNKTGGKLPGSLEEFLGKFLTPIVPWRDTLVRFMTQANTEDWSWGKRNTRYPKTYMPSLVPLEDGLKELVICIDTSTSITDPAVMRFNSEVKYIWESLSPPKMTIIQFDTKIHDVRVFAEGDHFIDIKVKGRGGTDMECLTEWAEEHRPDLMLIFSDMECDPMPRLSYNCSVLFAVIPATYSQFPDFGEVIEVQD